MDEVKDHLVQIQPAGFALRVGDGEVLMNSGQRQDVRWPSVCGGLAQCGVCAVEVVMSEAPLPMPSVAEVSMLQRILIQPRNGGTMRLACQFRVSCDMTVFRMGIRGPA